MNERNDVNVNILLCEYVNACVNCEKIRGRRIIYPSTRDVCRLVDDVGMLERETGKTVITRGVLSSTASTTTS